MLRMLLLLLRVWRQGELLLEQRQQGRRHQQAARLLLLQQQQRVLVGRHHQAAIGAGSCCRASRLLLQLLLVPQQEELVLPPQVHVLQLRALHAAALNSGSGRLASRSSLHRCSFCRLSLPLCYQVLVQAVRHLWLHQDLHRGDQCAWLLSLPGNEQ